MDPYRSATQGAVGFDQGAAGRVWALGRDRLDLLHRLSTQDLKTLPAGAVRATVLTTPIARIVDRLQVLNLGERLLLLTGVGRSTAVRKWLTSYIFFRDDVKLQDAGAELGQLALIGPAAGDVLATAWAGATLPADDAVVERDGLIVARLTLLGAPGLLLFPPAAEAAAWLERLGAAGAALGDATLHEQLRVRAGEPGAGHELTDAYIPLELDLWPAVSFTKGCYIGQEILARMESRGKLARRLRGLRAEAPLTIGAEVRATGSVAGAVTSAAELPDLGPIGLAVLRTGVEPGAVVDSGGVAATVVELPFIT